MLSIQAVRGLPRLRAPDIVPCIISFSRQLPCFPMMWPQYASFLAFMVSNNSLFTPALLRTHSFVFLAVHETRRIFLSPFISKALGLRGVSSFVQSWQPQQETFVAIGYFWLVRQTLSYLLFLFVSRKIFWRGSFAPVRLLRPGSNAPSAPR